MGGYYYVVGNDGSMTRLNQATQGSSPDITIATGGVRYDWDKVQEFVPVEWQTNLPGYIQYQESIGHVYDLREESRQQAIQSAQMGNPLDVYRLSDNYGKIGTVQGGKFYAPGDWTRANVGLPPLEDAT